MQCEEYECEASTSKDPVTELTELDSALHELGMLSSRTESRKDYLRESRKNILREFSSKQQPVLNLVEMNTRYVSSVSIGLRMKSVAPNLRMKPYTVPRQREERHRTRSENADVSEASTSLVASVIDAVVSVATDDAQTSIKKSKSLENVHCVEDNDNENLPEVELVSTCIQKLKMAE